MACTILAPLRWAPRVRLVGTFDNGGQGWTGQVKVGADYQFAPGPFGNIVAGVFADYDPSNLKGNFSTGLATGFNNPIDGQEKINSSWAVGGRIGFLVTPTVLTYVNGGYTNERLGGIERGQLWNPRRRRCDDHFCIAQSGRLVHRWRLSRRRSRLSRSRACSSIPNTATRYFNATTLPVTTTGGLGGSAPTGMTVKTNVQTVVSGLDYRFNWNGH